MENDKFRRHHYGWSPPIDIVDVGQVADLLDLEVALNWKRQLEREKTLPNAVVPWMPKFLPEQLISC